MSKLLDAKKRLVIRIARLEKQVANMEEKHKGRETTHFTYWGGFDLGYLKGVIGEMGETLDLLDSMTRIHPIKKVP